jgi:hypothetical protein
MKTSVFSDITLRSQWKVSRRFGGIYRRHHQCLLAICFMLVSYLAYSSILKVAATRACNNHLQMCLQLTYKPKLLFIWWINTKRNYEFLSGLRQSNVVPVMGEWNYSSTILTSALDGGEWWASRPGSFTLEKRVLGVHWIRGWMDCTAGLNAVE